MDDATIVLILWWINLAFNAFFAGRSAAVRDYQMCAMHATIMVLILYIIHLLRQLSQG